MTIQKAFALQQNLKMWRTSLDTLLGGIGTVEISTTIVDEITEEVFIPYEVYQAIYSISPHYLEELKIDRRLRDRYLQLRRQLELQYALLLTNNNSTLYSESLAPEVTRDLLILSRDTTTWENLPCRLPPPINANSSAESNKLALLLAEPQFNFRLRQLGNIKIALDRRNLQSTLTGNEFDLTYARTVIQLDGKINHHYASKILEHPQQQEIVQLHQKSVEAGIKQWYKLLQFVSGIVQRLPKT